MYYVYLQDPYKLLFPIAGLGGVAGETGDGVFPDDESPGTGASFIRVALRLSIRIAVGMVVLHAFFVPYM